MYKGSDKRGGTRKNPHACLPDFAEKVWDGHELAVA